MKLNKHDEQSRQTRKSILNAAEELFFTQGYVQTTVDDICKAAGITKGAFYHHFKNKDAVYRQRFIHKLDAYLEEHYVLSDTPSASEYYLKLAQCTFESSKICGKELIGQSMIGQLNNRESLLYESDRLHTQILFSAYKAAVTEEIFSPEMNVSTSIMLYACLMSGFLFKWASSPEENGIDWDKLLEMEILMMLRGASEKSSNPNLSV